MRNLGEVVQTMAAATDRKAIGDAVRFRNGLVSRNRIVLAAMTNRQSYADGTLSDDEIQFLAQTMTPVAGDDVAMFDKLLVTLNDLDDVQNIYHNAELQG